MAVSVWCFRSLIRTLRTKDPEIGALCPPARLLRRSRMDDEPGGCGRKSAGRGTGPLCGVLAAAYPRSRRGLVGPVLIGGSGLSPRCRFPRPESVRWPRVSLPVTGATALSGRAGSRAAGSRTGRSIGIRLLYMSAKGVLEGEVLSGRLKRLQPTPAARGVLIDTGRTGEGRCLAPDWTQGEQGYCRHTEEDQFEVCGDGAMAATAKWNRAPRTGGAHPYEQPRRLLGLEHHD